MAMSPLLLLLCLLAVTQHVSSFTTSFKLRHTRVQTRSMHHGPRATPSVRMSDTNEFQLDSLDALDDVQEAPPTPVPVPPPVPREQPSTPTMDARSPCVIKVLGVGGGGGNAVNRMLEDLQGRDAQIDFWAINTDAQALDRSLAPNVINVGAMVTRGLGAGGDPEVGKAAATESEKEIKNAVEGSDMVFVTAGMGGGTGSGAAPVVAQIARDAGCLTVGVVTKPFRFEGGRRMKQAQAAIEELRQAVDTLIVVSNDKLLQIVPEGTPLTEAFTVADDILRHGVVGMSEIIVKPGLINVDFADVQSVMSGAGSALMGIGNGEGPTRAQDAAQDAISSPLLDFPISQARGVVFTITGAADMTLQEINAAANTIGEVVHPDANIIFGAQVDEEMGGQVRVTVVATGFETPA